MAASSSGSIPILEADVLDYLRAHPETLGKIAALVPRRDRCYFAVALGGLGFVLALLSALGYTDLAIGALGGSMSASAGVLIAQFCGR